MSIKLMNGQKVVDFRVEEIKEVKVAPKEIEATHVKEDEFDFDLFESKWFKILAVVFVIGALALKFGFPEKPLDTRLGYSIGNYEYTHRAYGKPVYRLVTPRGPEWVSGWDNLQNSLEVYSESGVEGMDYREVKESEIYPDLTKSLEQIEKEIKLEEEKIKEFDKEFLKEEK